MSLARSLALTPILSAWLWAQFPPAGVRTDVLLIGDPAAMARAGNYGGAMYPAQRYLDSHPDSWGARWYLAGALYHHGSIDPRSTDEAIQAYGQVLAHMPQEPSLVAPVQFWRGRCQLMKGDFQAAHASFTASLATGDLQYLKEAAPYYWAGKAAVQAKAWKVSLPLLDQAIAATTNPLNKGDGWLWKSEALLGLGRQGEALDSAEAAIREYATVYHTLPPMLYLQRAECLFAGPSSILAIPDLKRVLEARPIGKEEKDCQARARDLLAGFPASSGSAK